MKIAIVTSTFPPYKGGMGNVAEGEARLLAERGHTVTVFYPQGPAPNLKKGTVPFLAKGAGPRYEIREVEPLLRYGNAALIPGVVDKLNGFDAVHLHYPFFGGAEWVAFWKRRHPKSRLVITYHMDVVGHGWLGLIFSFYSRFIMPYVLHSADAIAVSSLDYARTSPLLKLFWHEIESKLVEIPFHAPKSQITNHKSQTDPYFLFIGGLDKAHYFKGVENLIRAVGAHELRIVGDGDLRPRYETLAKELGVSERVKFLGAVPYGDEYTRVIAGARALVLPSVDRSEAFGLVLLDALACGIPLVASDLPGVRTVASDDVAIRVPPNDVTSLAKALDRMATDDALHAKFVANISSKLEKYAVEKYVAALEVALTTNH